MITTMTMPSTTTRRSTDNNDCSNESSAQMAFEKTLPLYSMYMFVNVFLFMHFVEAMPTIYTFGKTCPLGPLQLNEDETFYLSFYNSGKPSELGCSYIAFTGKGSNLKDRYRICTTLTRFSDPTCNLKLTLRKSLNGTVLKTYNCVEHETTTFCEKQGENLYIVAEFGETNKWVPSDFLFNVDATKTYDYTQMVAGVTCGAVGLFIIILVATVIKCRKMKNNGPILRERFRTIKDAIFCRNCSPDQERNHSTTARGTGTRQRSCVITPCSRLSQPASQAFSPYIVSDDPSSNIPGSGIYVDPGLLFALSNPRSPPPYQEEDNRAFDPPPEYSSLTTRCPLG